jgi:hypothetical protein
VSGRYILQPEVIDILTTQEKGAGGEIQLTDAMAKLIGNRRSTRSPSAASVTTAAPRPVSSKRLWPWLWSGPIWPTRCAPWQAAAGALIALCHWQRDTERGFGSFLGWG